MKTFLGTATPAAHNDEASPSSPKQEKSGFKKLKQMIRDMFSMCKYSATQAYEGRKDINRLLIHNGLSAQPLVHPPTFFVDTTSSEEEIQKDIPHDDEPLSDRLRKMETRSRGLKIAIKKTLRTPTSTSTPKPHGKAVDIEEEEEDDDDEPEAEEEASWSSE